MAATLKAPTMRASASKAVARPAKVSVSRRPLVCRADGGFIGSPTNLIMMASTTAFLASGRFGLSPTVARGTTAGLKLVDRNNAVGLLSNDPAGFTIVDVMAQGALGHVFGVGLVLGLRAIGAI